MPTIRNFSNHRCRCRCTNLKFCSLTYNLVIALYNFPMPFEKRSLFLLKSSLVRSDGQTDIRNSIRVVVLFVLKYVTLYISRLVLVVINKL